MTANEDALAIGDVASAINALTYRQMRTFSEAVADHELAVSGDATADRMADWLSKWAQDYLNQYGESQ